jgi:hypothetical protein
MNNKTQAYKISSLADLFATTRENCTLDRYDLRIVRGWKFAERISVVAVPRWDSLTEEVNEVWCRASDYSPIAIPPKGTHFYLPGRELGRGLLLLGGQPKCQDFLLTSSLGCVDATLVERLPGQAISEGRIVASVAYDERWTDGGLEGCFDARTIRALRPLQEAFQAFWSLAGEEEDAEQIVSLPRETWNTVIGLADLGWFDDE